MPEAAIPYIAPAVISAITGLISSTQQSNAAGKRADSALAATKKQNALDLAAANKRAADQLKVDKTNALRQQQSTLANLQLSSQQAAAQVEAQFNQQLLTREQLLGQQFLVEEQNIKTKSASDEKLFQSALRQSIQQERNKKLRRRDTVLTSPIVPSNSGDGVAIEF